MIPINFLHNTLLLPAVFRTAHCHAGIQTVQFIIDTGSDRSMLGYGDAIKMNLPLSKFPFDEHTRLGGYTIATHKMGPVALSFSDDKGGVERIHLDGFSVLVPTQKGIKREEVATIPSILGIDFMKIAKLSLFCNPNKNEAYFESNTR